MKKLFRLFTVALCAAFAAITLVACADPGAPQHSVSADGYAVTAGACEQKLEDFVSNNVDRTAASEGEERAAEYLQRQLVLYGYSTAGIDSFTYTVNNRNQTSQNVSAFYTEDGATDNVVLGAYYDNCYALTPSGSNTQIKAEGALANGSGVAALLAIAEYLGGDHAPLGFNVTIAFFGCSAVGTTGADEFFKQMDRSQKANTVLMVELQRLGVDHVYAYCGPSTEREAFFGRVASENGLDIYKTTQKSPYILGMATLDGVPYYQWAQTGLYGCFYNNGIPTLNLVGANWETIDLTDNESAFNEDIAFTSGDTLANIKRMYPDYGSKIALAASLVIRSMHDGEFLSVMKGDKASFAPVSVLSKGWIWALVLIGVLIIAYLVMNVVVRRMGKKYPIPVVQPKKIKMAVFGVDYEDRNPNDIYIDIKDPFADNSTPDEIFPGIPNNTRTSAPKNPTVITPIPFRRVQNADEVRKPKDAPDGIPKTDKDDKSKIDPFDLDKPTAPAETEPEQPAATEKKTSDGKTAEQTEIHSGKAAESVPETDMSDNARRAEADIDKSENTVETNPTEVKTPTVKKTAAKKTEKKGGLTEKTATKKSAKGSGLTGKAATTGKATSRTAKPETDKQDDGADGDK